MDEHTNGQLPDDRNGSFQNEVNRLPQNGSKKPKKPALLGILSLIFGLIGFAVPFFAVVGIILGIVGLAVKHKKGLCIAGLIISVIALFVSLSHSSNRSGTISNTSSNASAGEASSGTDSAAQGTTVTDNRTGASDGGESAGNTDVTPEDFDIQEYPYEDSIGDTMYFLVIKNNSQATVDISGNGNAVDSSGNTLGAADCTLDVLGPGEQSITYFYFDGVTGIDHVEYTLNYAPESYYKSVISEISLDETVNDQNLTVTATNNGDEPADFVEAYALFMDAGNNVTGFSSSYITDGDLSLQPGASLSVQLDAYDSFDHVECYITGRADSVMNAVMENGNGAEVSADQFTVEERPYSDSYSTTDYLVITNNSDKNVTIFGNASAKDDSDKVIGAADCSVDVLGPGETTITYFYFSGVQGVAQVDYQLTYEETDSWKPVLGDLSTDVTINDANAVVKVTNNGSVAAEFVQVYALFCDADGNVVYADFTYVTDDDSELKPGATLSAQLNSYESFDHVDVYLTGRRQ